MGSLVRGLDSRVRTPKMQEIDLKTGKPKESNPLKDANDYSKWDVINGQIDQDGDLVDFTWQQLPYDEIRVRIPVSKHTKGKQVKVIVKLNWLKVWAPAPDYVAGSIPEDRPPKEPLLDFQLYGAVDVEESDVWELVDDGAVRNVILQFKKSPAYNWPTLNRVGGLKREEDRARVAKEEKERFERENAKVEPPRETKVDYGQTPAGPARPPTFGPAPKPPKKKKEKVDRNPFNIPSSMPPLDPSEAKRPPGVYENGRIIVCEPDSPTDSDSD